MAELATPLGRAVVSAWGRGTTSENPQSDSRLTADRPKPTVGLRGNRGGNASVSGPSTAHRVERQLCSSGYDRIVPIAA